MATARIFHFTEEDLNRSGGGAYAEFDVPCEAPVRLDKVEDYDKREQGKTWGWIFYYTATTPSGKELEFRMWLPFTDKSRWKLVETLEAHGVPIEGDQGVDPQDLIGDELIALIDFPRNKQGEPTSDFREIRKLYPITVESPYTEDVSEELLTEDTSEETALDEPAVL